MDHTKYKRAYIEGILAEVKTIAIIGISLRDTRASWMVMKYLLAKNYDVYGINPLHAGETLFGREIYACLRDVPIRVDMVSIFRNAAAAGEITDEAIDLGVSIIWMQLGVFNMEAAQRAEKAGLRVVMNRCPKMEYGKLSGEWNWLGGNSGILSARRPKLADKGVQHFSLKRK